MTVHDIDEAMRVNWLLSPSMIPKAVHPVDALLKYSDDEARDDRGRWTSDGGGERPPSEMTGPELKQVQDESDKLQQAFRDNSDLVDRGIAKAAVAKDIAGRLGTRFDDKLIDKGLADRIEALHGAGFRLDNKYLMRTGGYEGTHFVIQQTDENGKIGGGLLDIPADAIPLTDEKAVTDALREDGVSKLVSAWAGTSNDHDPTALGMQEAVKEEFGLKGTSDWKLDGYGAEAVKQETAENGDLYRATARAMYDSTQADLAARGINELTVYRGVNTYPYGTTRTSITTWPPGYENLAKGPADGVTVNMRPLSSWSTDQPTAAGFALDVQDVSAKQAVMTAVVPASQVFSTPFTGIGCMSEAETVLLGGEMKVDVGKPDPNYD